MIIGITGGTGCGKTTALEAIRQLGGMVLDCDAIYYELLETESALLTAIESRFPGTVKNGNHSGGLQILHCIIPAETKHSQQRNMKNHNSGSHRNTNKVNMSQTEQQLFLQLYKIFFRCRS